jgi:hypothetical protein
MPRAFQRQLVYRQNPADYHGELPAEALDGEKKA